MELNEQDKERIIAEEKLRMETRKEFFKENFGGMHGPGGWGSPWRGGWHGYRCGGFGFFKGLFLALVIFGLFHLWHHPYCGTYPGYYYGAPAYPAPQSAPAPQPPSKN